MKSVFGTTGACVGEWCSSERNSALKEGMCYTDAQGRSTILPASTTTELLLLVTTRTIPALTHSPHVRDVVIWCATHAREYAWRWL